MKADVDINNLLGAVRIVEKVSGKNLTLPVLNSVLCDAVKDKIIVRATNLDLGIEVEVNAKVSEDGRVALSGSVFLNILSSLSHEKTAHLSVQGGNMILKTPNGTSTIKAVPHDDFPIIPKTNNKTLNIPVETLLMGLRSVWYSASLSSIKPELSSVYIFQNGKKVCFVATDSFRLAEKSIVVGGGPLNFEPLLIPFKNTAEISRVLEQIEGDVGVSIMSNQISFSHGPWYIVSRLVDGTFPDYQQIIPKEKTTEAVVLKQDLVNVLKKVVVFSDSFNQVRFRIDPAKKLFTVSSKNADVGETVENVNAALSGDPLEISFNHKYITDCFQALNADSVSLTFSGLARPMVIRGVSDASFLYLVMPMNK